MNFNLKEINEDFYKDKKIDYKINEIHSENNFYTYIENGDFNLYVGKYFFSLDNKISQFIIETVLTTLLIHGGSKKEFDDFFKLIKDNSSNLWLYLLNSKEDTSLPKNEKIISIFFRKLESYSMYEEFIKWIKTKLINREDISEINFIQFLMKKGINDNDLLVLFKEIRNFKALKSISKSVKLKSINTSNNPGLKGNIFQFLCSRILFKNSDKYYYNTNGGGEAGSLYPDLLFKYNDNIFICDAKCYKDESEITPHKEFFYNILISNAENKNNKTYGILFIYDQENIKKSFEIKKIYKLKKHCYYLVSINIEKCINVNLNNQSLCTQISNEILKIDLKNMPNDIELINYKISESDSELIDFLNQN